ncbi:MAG: ABC transporter substrate-binding protein [Thermodesulfovibrio sp.]|uniref:Helical backbone metal receptor n=1 Tax=Thermodesulfovibrio obliviosus TaxID=3118332 RepID=A0AAU8H324_9BACT
MRALVLFILFLFSPTFTFAQPERIISLAPSVTEAIYYLGAIDKLVAVSDYCKWPEEVKNKPKVGGMINPSYEKILALKPDLVIISKDVTPIEVYNRLIELGIKVHVYAPETLKDMPDELIKLGIAIGKERQAKIVAHEFQKNIKKVKRTFNNQKALFVIWTEPLTVAGKSSHINEVMNLLGLKNIAEYSSINIERVIKLNPEIIFFGAGHETVPEGLLVKLKDTKAVKKGNIYFISDKIYHLSPRIVEGIKEMAGVKIRN